MDTNVNLSKIWELLATVPDPEVPVLSVLDLGIVRDVLIKNDQLHIIITPTYTGCPAMDMISMNIRMVLLENGYNDVVIQSVLSPIWTTDWISESGKAKLKAYGIAPPVGGQLIPEDGIECPQCQSHQTLLISAFGSTACKALYKCEVCKEPFDYFKCH